MRDFDGSIQPARALFAYPVVPMDMAIQDREDIQDRDNQCSERAPVFSSRPLSSDMASARRSTSHAIGEKPTDLKPSTMYWRGASGRLYRLSAHTTVFCPSPQRGVYVLARRDPSGSVVPLFAGVAASAAGTLNLAHIRRRAVTIGATEVHLCPVHGAGSVFGLRRIVRDLRRSFAETA